MSGPFVVSMKLVGDASSAVAATKATERELIQLNRVANEGAVAMTRHGSVTGLSRVQLQMFAHEGKASFDMLAAGASPLRILGVEAVQLADALGQHEGGVAGSLKALAPLLAPFAIVAGAAAFGVAGLTAELDKSTGKNITFMETLKAVFQAAWDGVQHVLGPVVNQVGHWFGALIDFIVPTVKLVGNSIIGTFVAAYHDIIDTWKLLPDAIGDVAIQAANSMIAGIQSMLNGAIDLLDGFISTAKDHLGPLGGALSTIGHVDFGGGIANPLAGSAAKVANTFAANSSAASQDYMGGPVYGDIAKFALQNYNDDNKPKSGKAGKTSDYAKQIQSIKDATAALSTQSQVIGLSTFASAKLEKQQELMNAAMKDAVGLSPARVAEIDAQSSAYARQAARLETLNEIYNTGKTEFEDFFSTMNDSLKKGETVWEAFGDAATKVLNDLEQKALQAAADGLWNSLFPAVTGTGGAGGSGSGGGLNLGSILGPILGIAGGLAGFASGTASAPGGLARVNEQGGARSSTCRAAARSSRTISRCRWPRAPTVPAPLPSTSRRSPPSTPAAQTGRRRSSTPGSMRATGRSTPSSPMPLPPTRATPAAGGLDDARRSRRR